MEETIERQVWYDYGNEYWLKDKSVILEKLDNAVYVVNSNPLGYFLVKEHNSFVFDYKIYGLEEKFINRVIRTYEMTNSGNMGVLLNGVKGSGKTICSKIISNRLKQPVIIITKEVRDCHHFVNSIPQNITVFVDEYEKTYKDGSASDLLTIMDGALNSEFRRVFILTTNDLYVDPNLLQRPTRIRYLKSFGDLPPNIVEEIVDDILIHKHLKDDTIKFISSLELITVDIVKSVLEEVNLHEEAPHEFQDVFNVKRLTGKYNIDIQDVDGNFVPFLKNAVINRRPIYTQNHIKQYLNINDMSIGNISSVISHNIIEVSPDIDEDDEEEDIVIKEPIIIRVEDAEMVHYSYEYSNPTRPKKLTKTNNSTITSLAAKLGKEPAFDEIGDS